MKRIPAVLLVLVVMVLFIASPALAHPVQGGWGDNHQLCTTCSVNQGDVVGMWQSIMWADAFQDKCGASGVDGYFGSNTRADTIQWQGYWGLAADGVVGTNTWTFARGAVVNQGNGVWAYTGASHFTHYLVTGSNPTTWHFDPPTDSTVYYYDTSHPTVHFPNC